jgi:hypothetical protein
VKVIAKILLALAIFVMIMAYCPRKVDFPGQDVGGV